jgi:hypothetical protein
MRLLGIVPASLSSRVMTRDLLVFIGVFVCVAFGLCAPMIAAPPLNTPVVRKTRRLIFIASLLCEIGESLITASLTVAGCREKR